MEQASLNMRTSRIFWSLPNSQRTSVNRVVSLGPSLLSLLPELCGLSPSGNFSGKIAG